MRIRRVITIIGLAISIMILAVGLVSASEPVNPVRSNLNALATTSNGVKVAILDTGSNIAYKEGISLIDGTVRDYNGHGTLIASIIKEACPGAELYVIKVIGKDGLALSEEAVILGLRWAISRGVNIINMSLRLKDSERLHQAIREAFEREIIIIAAAGNKTPRIGLSTQYAIRNTQYEEVAYPAKYPEVIAVGALNQYGKVYNESAQSEEVDLYFRGYRGKRAGTSIASAYVAGTIARVISENPKASLEELKNIILITLRSNLLPKEKHTRQ